MTTEALPPEILAALATQPPRVSRKEAAALISEHVRPVTARALEEWPLPVERVGGRWTVSTAEALRLAVERKPHGETFPKSFNGPGWGGPANGAGNPPATRRIEGGGAAAKRELGPRVMQFRADYRKRREDELLQVWDHVLSDPNAPPMARIVATEKYRDQVYGPLTRKVEQSGKVTLEMLVTQSMAVDDGKTIDGKAEIVDEAENADRSAD